MGRIRPSTLLEYEEVESLGRGRFQGMVPGNNKILDLGGDFFHHFVRKVRIRGNGLNFI